MTSTLFEIDKNSLEKVLKLYERTPESFKEDVNNLKIWMTNQPHLPEVLDDKRIENFLILNKCSVERSKKSIDAYYTLRSQAPEILDNGNPSGAIMKETLEIIYWLCLPKMTKDNYRVIFFKMRRPEMIDKLEPCNVIALAGNIQELRLIEDLMFGDVIVMDVKGLNFTYITKLIQLLPKLIALYQKVYSMRLKGVYLLNSPPFMWTVVNVAKSLLKPKLAERIFVSEDISSLYTNFPKEILPKDYGGEEKSLEELQEIVISKFEQYKDRFDLLDTLRVKEDLRPGELTNHEILGFYGNFKKLNVD